MLATTALVLSLALGGAQAHLLAWSKGMYCKNGISHTDDPNAAYASEPLIGLHFHDWFMHGPCINYPPPAGEFLDLPAGGSFTVEIAGNRAFTTLSYNGSKTSDWPDGNDHPEGYGDKRVDTHFPLTELGCISSPNMHCKNEGDAAGTVFAIAYKSDIHTVTMDDLVVFTVAPNTPYKRVATYHVPAQLQECPEEGCVCAWGWVPNHCGQANEYMNGYRCRVTNVQANAKALAKPKNPVWCEGEPDKCVKGAKKMSYGYQLDGNTVNPVEDVPQADGQWKSFGYNMKLGFAPGAQNDIFVSGDAEEGTATAKPPTPTPAHTSSPVSVPSSSSSSVSTLPAPTSTRLPHSPPAEPTSSSTSSRPSHSPPAEPTSTSAPEPEPSTPAPLPSSSSSAPASSSSAPVPSSSSSSSPEPVPSSPSQSDPVPEPSPLPTQPPSSSLPSSSPVVKPTSTPDASFAPSAPSGQVDAAPVTNSAPAAPKPTATPATTKASSTTAAAAVPTVKTTPKRCPANLTQRSTTSSRFRHRRHSVSFLDRFRL